MKKLVRKTAVFLTAAVMMISMMGVQAFADDSYANTAADKSVTAMQSFTFESKLSVPADTKVPDVTIGYTIGGKGDSVSGRVAGPAGVTVGNATFSKDDTASDGYVAKSVTVTIPANTFNTVGIYRYEITQSIPADKGVTAASPAVQYLDVDVQNGTSGLEVSYFVLYNIKDSAVVKTAGFENRYNSHKLTVTKEVQGAQGDRTKAFSFPITITNNGAEVQKEYSYKIISGSQTEAGTFTSGTSQTVQLKHGDSIEITGLTAQDTYTVGEETVSDYTTTYKIGEAAAAAYTDALAGSITADTQITFINSKEGGVPTGLIMSIMPYALMIVFAVAAAAVLFRRKRTRFEK